MRLQAFALGLLIAFGLLSSALAETYSVSLNPTAASDARGLYLSASFDFGTAFSHINSVTLRFEMPSGYEGTAFTTGNSSTYRDLALVVHDDTSPIVDPRQLESTTALAAGSFRVLPQTPVEFGFGNNYVVFPGETPPEANWPSFLLSGHGKVSFVDVTDGSYYPLPDGIGGSSSTSWSSPGEVTSATLTVEGTAVPEPGVTVLMLTIGAVAVPTLRRKRT